MSTICPYCGVGCKLKIKDNKIFPDDYVTNKGMMCIKGATLLDTMDAGRVLYPMQDFKEITWSKAIEIVSTKFRKFYKKDKKSIGIYIGAQIPTEDQYLAVKLGKGYIGTPNFDSNVRLCMASAAYSLKYSFGDPSPTASYDEIERAETFFLVGVNPASSFPVLWNRILASRKRNGGKIIVIDPILTDSALQADIYIRINPGKDIILLNSIASVLLNNPKIIPEGFNEFKESAMKYTPERAAKILNIDESLIISIAQRISKTKTLFMWGMGVNQSPRGVDTGILISTLAILSGNVGKPGTGVLPLTGQHNSMGAREAGALAGMLPGLRYVTNEEEVIEVEDYWRLPRYSIPREFNTITEMYKLIEDRKIRGLWIIGTNPVISLPQSRRFKYLLSYVDLVVVQDTYFTETANEADIILPASSWLEREGIHTAGDRTVSYLPKLREAKGESKPDWEIIRDIGIAMGFPIYYSSVEEIFNEFKGLTKGRIDDISNLTYKDLERGYRWPNNESLIMPRIFRTKRIDYDMEFDVEDDSIYVITGRTEMHWNTRTRSSKSWILQRLGQDDYIFISNDLCEKLNIVSGEKIELETREGRIEGIAKCSDRISGNIVFMPFHWGKANSVMDWKVDPISKEPAFKLLKAYVLKKKDE